METINSKKHFVCEFSSESAEDVSDIENFIVNKNTDTASLDKAVNDNGLRRLMERIERMLSVSTEVTLPTLDVEEIITTGATFN